MPGHIHNHPNMQHRKRVKRIREYLDIKDTRREQEEDDQMWIENIEQDIRVIRPNPTRNRAQMDNDKGKTQERLNSTAEGAERTNGNLEMVRALALSNTRTPTKDQEKEVTSPLL